MKQEIAVTTHHDGSQVMQREARKVHFFDLENENWLSHVGGISLTGAVASLSTSGTLALIGEGLISGLVAASLGFSAIFAASWRISSKITDPGYDDQSSIPIPKDILKNMLCGRALLATQNGHMVLCAGKEGEKKAKIFIPTESGDGNIIMDTYVIKDGKKYMMEYVMKPVPEIVWVTTFDSIMALEADNVKDAATQSTKK